MSRTPLFHALRRAMRTALAAGRRGAPPADELLEISREQWTRRSLLKAAAGASLAVAGPDLLAPPQVLARTGQPRVVIVGAGAAGLNAAYRLKKAGVPAKVFDAGSRIGGRIYTARNLMAPGLTTELGGEFIDSGHEEMLALAREFRLELIDVFGASERNLAHDAYYFGGQHYTEAQVVREFIPLAGKIRRDADSLGDTVTFRRHTPAAVRLDRTSLAGYLDQIGATGWVRDLLEVAYVTEYGLEAGQQSSINLLFMIGTDLEDGTLEMFGESDERYKIRGGNQRIVDGLAARLPGQISTRHRLESVRSRDTGYRLSFLREGKAVEVDADMVLLCIPFTLLRTVELRVDLPGFKRNAIRSLGYGTNAKVMAGMTTRVWRKAGYGGNVFTDEAFQLGWDNSRQQGGAAGGLTFYSGGMPGITAGQGTAAEQVARLLPGADRAFPGVAAAYNGNASRFHWPTHPLTMASYACYKPGQWTTIAGGEITPVGRLFFAGEHCSLDFQGYMNGAAETGKVAAQSVLTTLRTGSHR